jgi:hypothetical protein
MAFSLSDALEQYRATVEATHRFWGYFQVAAAAAAGFAWTTDHPTNPISVYVALTVAFVFFAAFNHRLVIDCQSRSVAGAKSIGDYVARHPAEVPDDLKPLALDQDPDSVLQVRCWHALLSAGVVVAIWIAYWVHSQSSMPA